MIQKIDTGKENLFLPPLWILGKQVVLSSCGVVGFFSMSVTLRRPKTWEQTVLTQGRETFEARKAARPTAMTLAAAPVAEIFLDKRLLRPRFSLVQFGAGAVTVFDEKK